MLKLTPKAGPASVEARLTARGNLARRQNRFADVIDATPCAFIFMAVGASRNDSGGRAAVPGYERRSGSQSTAKRSPRFFSGTYLLPTIASRCCCLIPLKCDLQRQRLWHADSRVANHNAGGAWLKKKNWQGRRRSRAFAAHSQGN